MRTPLPRFASATDRAAVLGYIAGTGITSLLWIAAMALLGGAQ